MNSGSEPSKLSFRVIVVSHIVTSSFREHFSKTSIIACSASTLPTLPFEVDSHGLEVPFDELLDDPFLQVPDVHRVHLSVPKESSELH